LNYRISPSLLPPLPSSISDRLISSHMVSLLPSSQYHKSFLIECMLSMESSLFLFNPSHSLSHQLKCTYCPSPVTAPFSLFLSVRETLCFIVVNAFFNGDSIGWLY
ncbi:hypothetical protein PENTCL1PPCAC_6349, partial [Pristionchus entomophagus]